jgi:CheY-like chemotaxis protein
VSVEPTSPGSSSRRRGAAAGARPKRKPPTVRPPDQAVLDAVRELEWSGQLEQAVAHASTALAATRTDPALMGYRADVASNGLEAIECVERQTYDIVLMDVQMPDMDGLEASRRITAKWPAGRRPHIVAMTANAMQGDREQCLAAGMDDYVVKPIRVDALVAALSQVPSREGR